MKIMLKRGGESKLWIFLANYKAGMKRDIERINGKVCYNGILHWNKFLIYPKFSNLLHAKLHCIM